MLARVGRLRHPWCDEVVLWGCSMSSLGLDRAVAADAAAVTELVVALESSLYGHSTFSPI
jgi:hypothetical protein